MTVAQFYAAHAIDGRALLEGTIEHPVRWLVKVRQIAVGGQTAYVYCYGDYAIRVPGDRAITAGNRVDGVHVRRAFFTSVARQKTNGADRPHFSQDAVRGCSRT